MFILVNKQVKMFMPNELVYNILLYVPYFERLNMRLTSKVWNEIILGMETAKELEKAFFSYRKNIPIFCKHLFDGNGCLCHPMDFRLSPSLFASGHDQITMSTVLTKSEFQKLKIYSKLFVKSRLSLFNEVFDTKFTEKEIDLDDTIVLYFENEGCTLFTYGEVNNNNRTKNRITIEYPSFPVVFCHLLLEDEESDGDEQGDCYGDGYGDGDGYGHEESDEQGDEQSDEQTFNLVHYNVEDVASLCAIELLMYLTQNLMQRKKWFDTFFVREYDYLINYANAYRQYGYRHHPEAPLN